eukprot:Platyproteum_vivax@DN6179_c0_g1_i3.p1
MEMVQEYNTLNDLKNRTAVRFNSLIPAHEMELNSLWCNSFPDDCQTAPIRSAKWKQLGFQSVDPRTDFRGGGLLSLQCINYMAERKPQVFSRLVASAQAQHPYPFAACFISLIMMLCMYLRLVREKCHHPALEQGEAAPPRCVKVLGMLAVQEQCPTLFEEIAALSMERLHYFWLHINQTTPSTNLMAFNNCFMLLKVAVRNAFWDPIDSVEELKHRLQKK